MLGSPVALGSQDVLAALVEYFVTRGLRAHTRPGKVPEFIANAGQAWLAKKDARMLYIIPDGL
ncbi:MAG: hypothetical protein ACOYLK_09015 [Sphingomonas sp.]